jgi:serine/threonine-protein kinase
VLSFLAVSTYVGSTLAGRYLLVSVLGQGGMGEVYGAKDLETGQDVAVKLVRRSVVDETLLARLEREAVAARRIKSAYIPRVHAVARTAEGELFLVMELLHGVTLSHRLRERGVLTFEELRPIVEDILIGLCDAHAAGVIHRDLKPGNVFLERWEEPTVPVGAAVGEVFHAQLPAGHHQRTRILDFGVCKLQATDAERLTSTGEAVGTVSYMAPEQIRGASDVDARADLYAVAMLAFEALCGRLAVDGTTQMAIIAAKLESSARRLGDHALVPVPVGLESLLARCLARRPSDRPASAAEVLQSWRALGPAVLPPRAVTLPVGVASGPTETALSAGTIVLRGSLGTRIGLALATVALVAATLVLVTALRRVPPAPVVTAAPSSTLEAPATAAPLPVQTAVAAPDPEPLPQPDAGAKLRPPTRPRPTPTRPKPRPTGGVPIATEPRY